MSYDNQRAANGQAYNLAIQSAIAEGRGHDNEYIIKQFLRHKQFCALLQKANPHQLSVALKSEPVRELINELEKQIGLL